MNAPIKWWTTAVLLSCTLAGCQNKSSQLDSSASAQPILDSINARILEEPNNADLYFDRAKYYYVNRDLASAMSDVGRALKMDSTDVEYYLLLADLKLINRQSKESIEALQTALRMQPDYLPALLKLGEMYMIVQDAEASFKYLNQVLRIDVHNADAYRLKGFNYKYLGDTAKAVSSFQTAVEQNPQDYDAYFQLGLLYSSRLDPLAISYYDNALTVKPGSVEVLYAKGLHFQESGQLRDAIRTYAEISALQPDFEDAYYNQGYIYLEHLQEYDSAAVFFSRAIEHGPANYYEAVYNRGLCRERAGEPKLAEEDYREALRMNPQFDLAAESLSRLID